MQTPLTLNGLGLRLLNEILTNVVSISEKVVSNLQLAGGSLWALRFLHHLKLIFPTPLLSHSIVPFLYRQILGMHVKPNKIGVKPTTLIAGCGNSRITGKTGSHVTRNNLER